MAMQKQTHLTTLIAKFYHIGKHKYNGKVYDNILNIFEELDIEEQKELIRGTLGVYASATSAIIHEREVIDRGDIQGLLSYLKKAKEMQDTSSSSDTDEGSSSKKGSSNDDSLTTRPIGVLIALVIGVIIYTCLYISSLAMDDDPAAMAKAKVFKSLFDVIMIMIGH